MVSGSSSRAWSGIGYPSLAIGLRRREDQGLIPRDHDGVLVMRGQAAVRGGDGPPVRAGPGAPRARGDDRLEGDDESLGERFPRRGVVEVQDLGRLVDGAADAVPAELAEHGEAASPDLALDLPADDEIGRA